MSRVCYQNGSLQGQEEGLRPWNDGHSQVLLRWGLPALVLSVWEAVLCFPSSISDEKEAATSYQGLQTLRMESAP